MIEWMMIQKKSITIHTVVTRNMQVQCSLFVCWGTWPADTPVTHERGAALLRCHSLCAWPVLRLCVCACVCVCVCVCVVWERGIGSKERWMNDRIFTDGFWGQYRELLVQIFTPFTCTHTRTTLLAEHKEKLSCNFLGSMCASCHQTNYPVGEEERENLVIQLQSDCHRRRMCSLTCSSESLPPLAAAWSHAVEGESGEGVWLLSFIPN